MGDYTSKVFTVNNEAGGQITLSIIVTFPSFPNNYLPGLIDSTSNLSVIYELILLTESIDQEKAVTSKLAVLSKGKKNLARTRLVLISQGDGKGAAFARNLGSALAESSTLLFIDDDVRIWDDVASLIRLIKAGKCQAIQPLLVKFDQETVDSAGDSIHWVDSDRYTPYCRFQGIKRGDLPLLEADEIPYVRSAFMLVAKDALIKIGGFDSTFFFNYEDVDLGFRMTLAGYKLLFVPQIKALHKGSRTSEKMSDRMVRLSILNTHAMYLKIAPYSRWLYILLSDFERSVVRYELSRLRIKKVGFSVVLDFLVVNQQFIDRLRQARLHRKILLRLGVVGRQKLEDMARGKRLIYKR